MNPETTILSLPNELISIILDFVLASDVPVHLEHFMSLGQQYKAYKATEHDAGNSVSTRIKTAKDRWEGATQTPCSTALDSSWHSLSNFHHLDWFLQQMDPSQTQHFLDWVIVNSTCRRLRTIGKESFFSTKTFVFTNRLFAAFCEGNAKNLSCADQTSALEYITKVIVHMKPVSVASQFLCLPKYQRFGRLRQMSIQPGVRGDESIKSLNAAASKWNPLPKELFDLLRGIGLRVEKLDLGLLYSEGDRVRQVQMEALAQEVYPWLRIVASRKAKKEKLESRIS